MQLENQFKEFKNKLEGRFDNLERCMGILLQRSASLDPKTVEHSA